MENFITLRIDSSNLTDCQLEISFDRDSGCCILKILDHNEYAIVAPVERRIDLEEINELKKKDEAYELQENAYIEFNIPPEFIKTLISFLKIGYKTIN